MPLSPLHMQDKKHRLILVTALHDTKVDMKGEGRPAPMWPHQLAASLQDNTACPQGKSFLH